MTDVAVIDSVGTKLCAWQFQVFGKGPIPVPGLAIGPLAGLSKKSFPNFKAFEDAVHSLQSECAAALHAADKPAAPDIWGSHEKPSTVQGWSDCSHDGEFGRLLAPQLNNSATICGFVCLLCRSEGKSWKESLRSIHLQHSAVRNKLKVRWSNAVTHVQNKHKAVVSKSAASAIRESAAGAKLFGAMAQESNKGTLLKVKALAVEFQVDAGLPDSVLQRASFDKLMMGASELRKGSWDKLKKRLQLRMKEAKMMEMYFAGRCLLGKVRNFYTRDLTDAAKLDSSAESPARFVTGAHDGYDSRRRKAFGGSVSLIDPTAWKLYKFGLGMCASSGGTSEHEAAIFWEMAEHWGLERLDLLAVISDTASAALKTSRLLLARVINQVSEEEEESDSDTLDDNMADGDSDDEEQEPTADGSKCDLHLASLVFKISLGLENRQFIDQFKEGAACVKEVTKCCAWIMDKRCKGRYSLYKKAAEAADPDTRTFRFAKASDTRICFQQSCFESALRSFYSLRAFFESDSVSAEKAATMKIKSWELLAQFEDVLRNVVSLTKLVQMDNTPSAGVAVVSQMMVKLTNENISVYKVVDLDGIKWTPQTSFANLVRKSSKLMTVNDSDTQPGVVELMDPAAVVLRNRVEQLLDKFFPELDDNALLGILLNPITLTTGKVIVDQFDSELWGRAVAVLERRLIKEAKALKPEGRGKSPRARSGAAAAAETEDLLDFGCLFSGAMAAVQESNTEGGDAIDDAAADARKELADWLQLSVDWSAEARRQGHDLKLPADSPANSLRIATVVDPLPLFLQLQTRFPLVSRLAAKILAIPAANSYQERFFSFATWIDTDYSQRVSAITFERNVLLKVNGGLMSEVANSDWLEQDDNLDQRLDAFHRGDYKEFSRLMAHSQRSKRGTKRKALDSSCSSSSKQQQQRS